MAKRYNYDDDLELVEDYYGKDLGEDVVFSLTEEQLHTAPDYYSGDIPYEELSLEEKTMLWDIELNSGITKDSLTYGEDDPVEYVDNIVLNLTGEDGITLQYELLGRIDIKNRAYIIVHRMNDVETNSLVALRAWDDEATGMLMGCEITDEEEAKEVYEEVMKLFTEEYDEWEDIPGGGVQWDD